MPKPRIEVDPTDNSLLVYYQCKFQGELMTPCNRLFNTFGGLSMHARKAHKTTLEPNNGLGWCLAYFKRL